MKTLAILWFALCNIYLADNIYGQTESGLEGQTTPELLDNVDLNIGSEKIEDASNKICTVCDCNNQTVDCSYKNIETSFEISDWNGLIPFAPITVDLSNNPLKALTRISNVSTIQYLNVSHCEIESIEFGTFSYLKDLISLDLSGNRLATSSINRRVFLGLLHPDHEIRPFQNIKHMSLANNDIHSLAQDTFMYMSTLTTLDLSGNPLDYIDQVTMGVITDFVDLKELNLSGCHLETLPEGMFRRQRRLKRLDLSDNKFTSVPTSLGEAVSVEYLDFGKNAIDVLNDTNPIKKLTKLKELRLNRLPKLRRITDGALSGLADLEVLDLSYNIKLCDLEDEFLSWHDEDTEHELWPSLREFYLNNNNLSTVYSGYLERWDLLSKVDLSNNSFLCDCNSQWLIDVYVPTVSNSESNTTLGNMICKKPKDMKGISILQLYTASKQLPCPESSDITEAPVSDLAIILGIMIGIFVTFPLVLVVILLWRRGVFAKCRNRRVDSDDEEETDAFEVREIKVNL